MPQGIQAAQKLIQEDGVNGLPVRHVDPTGSAVNASNPLPVVNQAAATRLTLQASAAQTASGQSAAVGVGSYRELELMLSVTAVAGTGPQLNVFIDESPDGGVTWFQKAQLGSANIGAVPGANPSGYSLALSSFGDTVRVRWTVAGTAPSFTFAVLGVAK